MVKFPLFIGPINWESYEISLVCSSLNPSVGQFNILLRSRWFIFSNYYLEVTLLYHLKTDRAYFSWKFFFALIWAKRAENRAFCIFWKFCHLIFLKTVWKDNCDTWLHFPNSMSGKISLFELLPKVLSADQIARFKKVQ